MRQDIKKTSETGDRGKEPTGATDGGAIKHRL